MTEPRTPEPDENAPDENAPDENAAVHELLGAYALHAVDAGEQVAIEEHLLDDQDARAELHALQLGAAWLQRSAERPSASTWDAIAAEMRQDLAREAVVAPLRPRRSVATRALALAAAFVAVIAVAGGIRSAVGPTRFDDAVLANAVDRARELPGTREVDLQLADGTGSIEAVVRADGSGLALPRDLPALDERRTYQLWAMSSEGVVSLGTMGPDPGAHSFELARDATALAVTKEPRGGSTQPTGARLAEGDLSAA